MEVFPVNTGNSVNHIYLEHGPWPLHYRWHVSSQDPNKSIEGTGTAVGKRRALQLAVAMLERIEKMDNITPLPGEESVVIGE